MLRMCDGCKDVLDTDQDGSSVSTKWSDNIGIRSPHFVAHSSLDLYLALGSMMRMLSKRGISRMRTQM